MRKTEPTAIDLPDDVVLRVSGVSKKFCRNLRRSMWYGIQDLSKNLMGKTADYRPQTADFLGQTADRRPQTVDFLGGSASGSEDAEVAPSGGSQGMPAVALAKEGLQSAVFSQGSAVCSLRSAV